MAGRKMVLKLVWICMYSMMYDLVTVECDLVEEIGTLVPVQRVLNK